MRVCRAVRGLETNVRDGREGLGGRVRGERVWGRRDVEGRWRAEDGRWSRSLGVAFMLAGLFRDTSWISWSVEVVNLEIYRRCKQPLNERCISPS